MAGLLCFLKMGELFKKESRGKNSSGLFCKRTQNSRLSRNFDPRRLSNLFLKKFGTALIQMFCMASKMIPSGSLK